MKPSLESLIDGILLYCDKHRQVLEVNDIGKSHFSKLDWQKGVFLDQLVRSPKMELPTFIEQVGLSRIVVFSQFVKSRAYGMMKTKHAEDGSFYIILRQLPPPANASQSDFGKTLSMIADYSSNCVIKVNSEGHILYANQRFIETFELKQKQEIDISLADIFKNKAGYAVIQYEIAGKEGSPLVIEQAVECVTRRGKQIWLNMQLHPVMNSDNTVIILDDVSEQVTTKQNLQKAKAVLRDADEERTRLLANISHELRTPLTSIRGMLSNIALTQPLNIAQEELSIMLHASDSLNSVIEEMLIFAQDPRTQLKLQKRQVNLHHFIKQIFSMAKAQHQGVQHIEFELHMAQALPKFVSIDPFRVQQIVFNLLANAFKFTDKGLIKLDVRHSLVDIKSGEFELYLDVSDTGVGIPSDKLSTIFVPFQQLDNQASRSASGLGLGLSIVEKLLGVMQGRIMVKSELGLGSTFSVTLPIQLDESPQTEAIGVRNLPEHIAHKSVKILLAEDNLINAEIISRHLSSNGHKVTLAKNGNEAIEMLYVQKFDLVLMDVQMPVMDGFVATQRARRDENIHAMQGKRIPILGLTADATEIAFNQCILSGMDDVVQKPIDFETLYTAIFHQVDTQEKPTAATIDLTEEIVVGASPEALVHQAEAEQVQVAHTQQELAFFEYFKIAPADTAFVTSTIDMAVAMDYAKDDHDFYQQCLTFLQSNINKAISLLNPDSGVLDYSALGFETHQLASASGMLGAIDLSVHARTVSTEIESKGQCDDASLQSLLLLLKGLQRVALLVCPS